MAGYRAGPLNADKNDKHVGMYRVGNVQEYRNDNNKTFVEKFEMQETQRPGFGGGFKIHEQYAKTLTGRRKEKKSVVQPKEREDKEGLTKEEILAHLNLSGDDNVFSS